MANCWYSGGSVLTAPSNSDLWMAIPLAEMMTGSASAGVAAVGAGFGAGVAVFSCCAIATVAAAKAVDGVGRRHQVRPPLAIGVVHPLRVLVGTVQRRQRGRLRDRARVRRGVALDLPRRRDDLGMRDGVAEPPSRHRERLRHR